MKKISIVAVLFLGLWGVGCGRSANECSTLGAAYTKASMGAGCSSLAATGTALTNEAGSCPSTINAAAVSCVSACISGITSCTNATVLEKYATCVAKCPAT
jgi:hypothetical protein